MPLPWVLASRLHSPLQQEQPPASFLKLFARPAPATAFYVAASSAPTPRPPPPMNESTDNSDEGIKHTLSTRGQCDNATLELIGVSPPVYLDVIPSGPNHITDEMSRLKPITNMLLSDASNSSVGLPARDYDDYTMIVSDARGWGRFVHQSMFVPKPPYEGQPCKLSQPVPQGGFKVNEYNSGSYGQCDTLRIEWEGVRLPSAVYIVSINMLFNKAWRIPLNESSGALDWALALPSNFTHTVTVSGEAYAGVLGPWTVLQSRNTDCLSAKALSVVTDSRTAPFGGSGASRELGLGALVGVIIGSLVAAMLITALVIWYSMRRRRRRTHRTGVLDLHEEADFGSETDEHPRIVPFVSKSTPVSPVTSPAGSSKGAGTRDSPAGSSTAISSGRSSGRSKTRSNPPSSEPEQEVDADAPMMRGSGAAPPSYSHVLWVTNSDSGGNGTPTTGRFSGDVKRALADVPELSEGDCWAQGDGAGSTDSSAVFSTVLGGTASVDAASVGAAAVSANAVGTAITDSAAAPSGDTGAVAADTAGAVVPTSDAAAIKVVAVTAVDAAIDGDSTVDAVPIDTAPHGTTVEDPADAGGPVTGTARCNAAAAAVSVKSADAVYASDVGSTEPKPLSTTTATATTDASGRAPPPCGGADTTEPTPRRSSTPDSDNTRLPSDEPNPAEPAPSSRSAADPSLAPPPAAESSAPTLVAAPADAAPDYSVPAPGYSPAPAEPVGDAPTPPARAPGTPAPADPAATTVPTPPTAPTVPVHSLSSLSLSSHTSQRALPPGAAPPLGPGDEQPMSPRPLSVRVPPAAPSPRQ